MKEIEPNLIHTYYQDEDRYQGQHQDKNIWRTQRKLEKLVAQEETLFKLDYCNGNNEVVQIFNQKCVICIERDSEYAFRKNGYQCASQNGFNNEDDINIKKMYYL